MENGNYYLDSTLDDSGVEKTKGIKSPLREYNTANGVFNISPRNKNVGQYFTTPSKMDETMGGVPEVLEKFDNINNFRADKQGTFDRIGNALVNNITIAGTTAVGGILGLTEGIFSAAANEDISKLWDNNVNKATQDIQTTVQENFPIYQGDNYKNKSIWEKLGTDIFWANSIQALGYTEGMLLPGMAVSKMLSSAPTIVKTVIPSLVASMGEASIEAINNKREEVDYKKQVLLDGYNEELNRMNSVLSKSILSSEYLSELDNIEKDANKAGNFVFGSNIALLTLSNTIQFGNIFSRGYNTSRKLSNNLQRSQNTFTGLNTTKEIAKGIGRGTLNALSEGLEEVSQGIVAKTPSLSKDFNSFNESKFNQDKRELVTDMWSALGQSLSESMKDPNTAEEFASGFIIGALGMPTLKKSIIPIKFEGGIYGEISDHIKEAKRSQELATSINDRINNSKEIKSYYNGLVRNLAIQDKANTALDNHDSFEYNNANSAKLISDIMMFDDAGHIDYLKDLVNKSVDYSPEGISNIIKETSIDGNGPFMSNNNPLDINEVSNKLKEKTENILSKIDTYLKDKESLYTIASPELSEESLQSALYIKSQLRDWDNRSTELSKEIGEVYNNLETDNKIDLTLLKYITKDSELIKGINSTLSALPQDEYTDLSNKLTDLSKINSSIIQYKDNLKDILTNPTKSNNREEDIINKSIKKNINKKSNNLKDKLSTTNSIPLFREILNEEIDPIVKDQVIKDLEKEGNPLPTKLKEIDLLYKSISNKINESSENDNIKDDVLKLLDNMYNNAEDISDITSNSVYIDPNIIFDDNLSNDENINKFTEVEYLLGEVLNNVSKDKKFKDNFKPILETSIDSYQTIGVLGESNINTQDELISPISNISNNDVIKENNIIQEKSESVLPSQRSYYRPAIPEIHIEYSKKKGDLSGDFRPFNIVIREASNLDFDIIYNYLKDSRAFDYVNEGNLKVGSIIGFMIDPLLEEQMKSFSWYKGPTILMIDKLNNQIVGSLDESEYSVDKFEGLADLKKSIGEEYSKSSKNNKFISNITTKVAQLMVGKIPTNLVEKNLSDIPNINKEGNIFGIIKNGQFYTNNSISSNLITNITNISDKEGRLYLLLPNAKGEFTPSAVRLKYFNKNEFDINDINTQNTPLYKDIYNAISLIANSTSKEELRDAYKALSRELYLGNIHIDLYNTDISTGVRLIKIEKDKQGKEIYEEIDGRKIRKEEVKLVHFTDKSIENRIYNIMDVLLDFGLLIQVDSNRINTPGYNNKLINSNVLTSNMTDARVISSWFTTNTINSKNEINTVYNKLPNIDNSTDNSNTTPIKGTLVNINDVTYIVDLSKNMIYDKNNLSIIPDNKNLILNIAWANSNFGNITNNSIMINNKILLPNGKVLDRTNNTYLGEEESNNFKEELSKLSKNNQESLPIFNTLLESQVRVDRTSTDFKLDDSSVGYYIEDGEIVKGYLSHVLDYEGNKIYMTKLPIFTKGFNKVNRLAYNMYKAIFPNGESITIIKNDSSISEIQAKESIMSTLLKNPTKIVSVSNNNTLISSVSNVKTPITKGIVKSIQMEDRVNNKNISRVVHKLPKSINTNNIKVSINNVEIKSNNTITNTKVFNSLDNNIKDILSKKGWTEDKFNSISQEERNQLIDCIYL